MNGDFLNSIAPRPLSGRLSIETSRSVPAQGSAAGSPSFADVFGQAVQASGGQLTVSAHASARMKQRGLVLTPSDYDALNHAVASAAEKGCKDTYICYGNAGFVVNVPHRVMVTAMAHGTETLVTNVDSVVIVGRPDQQGAAAAMTD